MMVRRIVAIFFLALVSAWGAELTPYALESEARHNPVGIDQDRPRLGWKLKSDRRGDAQAAYEILVASAPEKLSSGIADLWDSGRVSSPETTWIPYAGTPLHSFQQCWWKVRVWSDSGESSPWSEAAEWTMGLSTPRDRRGMWISTPGNALRSGPMPLFRKQVTVERPVRRALVFVAGLGSHELRINGAKVGDHVLAPAWTNYRQTVLYESFDITSMVKTGPNAIGVLLGNGFYNVVGGRYSKYTGSFGAPRLWLQLHLEFDDGTSGDIGTDLTWRVHDGPITFSDVYGGEDFDARLEPAGWDRPGFDDSNWSKSSFVEPPGGTLKADSSPPVRALQTFEAIHVSQPKPGVFVYDLGQNFAGWPKIAVSGPAGASVRLTPGELLDAPGLVSQRSSGSPTYFTYSLMGSGTETWSPRFSYYGFRYVQVEGAAPESDAIANLPVIHNLKGEFIYLDVERTGRFSSSDETLNRIHALIDAAVRSNLQHVLTDCPHREKLGWLEESYLMGPSLLYNWDLRSFLPKIVRDIHEAQTIDGLIPDIAPEYVVFNEGFRDSPEWGSAGIFLTWSAWQWYGDMQPLSCAYRTMKAYTAYLGSKTKDGLLTYGLGDWYDIGPGEPGYAKLTPPGVTATATYFADLRVLEQTARLLGQEGDAKSFQTAAETERQAFEKAFYRPAESGYATGSQTSLAMPLVMGLAPDFARGALVDKLVADIRRAGNHPTAGDVGYHYVVEALTYAGRSDVLFDMATVKTAPSYAAQLAAGATSLTEAWDANPHSSQNHFMLGHIEEWFFAGLAGIRPDPDVPGMRHIIIKPQPVGDVKSVNAAWDSFRGPVSVEWHRDQGTFRLAVDIPPGTSADLYLPAASASQISSSGSPVSQDPAFRFIRQEGNRFVYAIPSGRYELQVRDFVR
jgi:alpha-L-rhamnosidase